MSDQVKPKPLFYIVLALVVGSLVLYGLRGILFPRSGGAQGSVQITKDDLKTTTGTEAPDANVPTTVKEYTFKASEKLPPITATSGFEPLQARTVKFALNVWAGWAPIILQNNGGSAGVEWKTPGGTPFKVELVLIDNPVDMRDTYAAGKVHVGWATLDMLPLFMDELKKDPRIMPRSRGRGRATSRLRRRGDGCGRRSLRPGRGRVCRRRSTSTRDG